MKSTILIGLALCASLLACQNDQNSPESTDSESSQKAQVDLDSPAHSNALNNEKEDTQNCYTYIKNRDSILLSTKTSGSRISGNLEYNLYEKDRNSGTVAGEVHGDTLLLNYTFGSEGRQSVRQLAFLKQGNTLMEGYADLEEIEDTVVFKHPEDLKFSKAMVLEKTGCPIR